MTMQDSDLIVNNVLESYKAHDITRRIDPKATINRDRVIEIVETMRRILFPGFFAENKAKSEYLLYIVGERVEFVHYNLRKQINNALSSNPECGCPECSCMELAEEITQLFLKKIPEIREYLYTDVVAAYNGDPAAYSTDEIIFSYPGLFAITVYRMAHELFILKVPMIPRIMTEYAHSLTGIDIHPGASIGKYFFIDHGTGIVIGETTVIGNNVKIYQGVTLGALSTRKGQQLKGVKRHPTLGNYVTIYSGTSVLGGETVIGDGATIGGNAFIVESVPAGTKVSVKNPELQFSEGTNQELNQNKNW